jgi:flagellar protein FliL
MSAAAAAPPVDAGAAPPAKKSKKKLIIIVAAVLLVLGAAGGGAVFYLKKKAAAAAEAVEDEGGAAHHAAKPDPKHPPTFVPLDPFVVNLADRDADRYAQIGITLELDDAKFADQLKAFMPAIRNGILMVLAHKTSQELLARSGKEALAAEILREAVRPLGIEVSDGTDAKNGEGATDEDADPKGKTKGKAKAPKHESEPNPVRRVHFSNFIIQ